MNGVVREALSKVQHSSRLLSYETTEFKKRG